MLILWVIAYPAAMDLLWLMVNVSQTKIGLVIVKGIMKEPMNANYAVRDIPIVLAVEYAYLMTLIVSLEQAQVVVYLVEKGLEILVESVLTSLLDFKAMIDIELVVQRDIDLKETIVIGIVVI